MEDKGVFYIRLKIFLLFIRMYISNAQITPLGFLNGVEWRLMVKGCIPKVTKL